MDKNENFESAMEKLEKIVTEMESGNVELEKSIEQFVEGMEISKFCSDKLEEMEKKVYKIAKDSEGNITEVPFDEGVDDEV